MYSALKEITAAIARLNEKIKAKPDVLLGTVASVSGGTANVTIDGDANPSPTMKFVTCSAGDRVVVIKKDRKLMTIARNQ